MEVATSAAHSVHWETRVVIRGDDTCLQHVSLLKPAPKPLPGRLEFAMCVLNRLKPEIAMHQYS